MRRGLQSLSDFLICLRFFTRLPIPELDRELAAHSMPDFARATGLLPLAGAFIGALAALALGAAVLLGLPPLLASPISIAALVLLTGALHEDGLADCADGFGGGTSRERKLEIMKDSRIGTFGAVALLLALYVRIISLSFICEQSFALAATVLIAASAFSRSTILIPLLFLSPARQDGAGFSAAKPKAETVFRAFGLAILIAIAPIAAGADSIRTSLAILVGALAAFGMTRLSAAQIQGQTGDVAGATQQLTEIAFYLVFATRL
jgi:adenosylcobinamide-GDP ribazoletransferase